MIDVLFIVGDGRSGSTLLERLLGEYLPVTPVGELRFVWERGFHDNQLCGCGQRFLACPFWQGVRARAFGAHGRPSDNATDRLRHAVDRARFIPELTFPKIQRKTFRESHRIAQDLLASWYAAIAAEAGTRVLVDSSKDPSYAFVLSTIPGIRVHYVHLVRDSRAVAYSKMRPKVRPEVYWRTATMDVWSLRKSAIEWNLKSLQVGLLANRFPNNVIRIQYERLVKEPAQVIASIATMLGGQQRVDSYSSACSNRQPFHTVSGNPIRFNHGPLEIKEDREWRTEMPRGQRIQVSLYTLGPMLRYYGLRGVWRGIY